MLKTLRTAKAGVTAWNTPGTLRESVLLAGKWKERLPFPDKKLINVDDRHRHRPVDYFFSKEANQTIKVEKFHNDIEYSRKRNKSF